MPVSPQVRRLLTPLVDQIVYASTAYTDLKSALNQQAGELIDFSRPPAGERDARLRSLLSCLLPHDVPDVDLVRVGGRHDGGYVMASDFAAAGAVSVGVGPDVSWDRDIANRGVPVAMFDPTVRRLPAPVPGGRFFRVGVSGAASPPPRFRPLPELVALAGFAADDLLLKMDVEGAEWEALASLPSEELRRYRQIVLELHDLSRLNDANRSAEPLKTAQMLREHHTAVHIHANNYSRLVRFDADWFPDSIEVSLIRHDLAVGGRPAQRLRTDLDVPSDPRVEDIDLSGVLTLAGP